MNRVAHALSAFALVASFLACDGGDGPSGLDCEDNPNHPDCAPDDPQLTGTLYYSSANTLVRYDFDTHSETSLFDGGTDYTVSPNGLEFAWSDYRPAEEETRVQIHDVQDPASLEAFTLPSIEIEGGLSLAPGTDLFGALVPASDAPFSRTDLLIFDREGAFVHGFRYVHA